MFSPEWFRRTTRYNWHIYKHFFPSMISGWKDRHLLDSVEAYCMFIGYPRSGHTLVGTLINAHPDAVIANELDALLFLRKGFHRRQIFSLLLERDRWFSKIDREWTGYSYSIPGQWQGRFRTLKVIGDKKGGKSTRRFRERPYLLQRLISSIGVPIRIVHTVRNPFDNISTICRRHKHTLPEAINFYFECCETNLGLINSEIGDSIYTFHLEELIHEPQKHLIELCSFLDLEPIPEYFQACTSLIAPSPSLSRFKIEWGEEDILQVLEKAAGFPFLQQYSFNVTRE